jgi:hypothetical protein
VHLWLLVGLIGVTIQRRAGLIGADRG